MMKLGNGYVSDKNRPRKIIELDNGRPVQAYRGSIGVPQNYGPGSIQSPGSNTIEMKTQINNLNFPLNVNQMASSNMYAKKQVKQKRSLQGKPIEISTQHHINPYNQSQHRNQSVKSRGVQRGPSNTGSEQNILNNVMGTQSAQRQE